MGRRISLRSTLALTKEHHDIHEILWARLPELKTIVPEFYDTPHCRRSWIMLLATFVFYPSYSLGSACKM